VIVFGGDGAMRTRTGRGDWTSSVDVVRDRIHAVERLGVAGLALSPVWALVHTSPHTSSRSLTEFPTRSRPRADLETSLAADPSLARWISMATPSGGRIRLLPMTEPPMRTSVRRTENSSEPRACLITVGDGACREAANR
jgi:hypothetical protein